MAMAATAYLPVSDSHPLYETPHEADFGRVPIWMLAEGLSANAMRFTARAYRWYCNNTYRWSRSRRVMAADMGWSVRTLDRTLAELKRAGALISETRYSELETRRTWYQLTRLDAIPFARLPLWLAESVSASALRVFVGIHSFMNYSDCWDSNAETHGVPFAVIPADNAAARAGISKRTFWRGVSQLKQAGAIEVTPQYRRGRCQAASGFTIYFEGKQTKLPHMTHPKLPHMAQSYIRDSLTRDKTKKRIEARSSSTEPIAGNSERTDFLDMLSETTDPTGVLVMAARHYLGCRIQDSARMPGRLGALARTTSARRVLRAIAQASAERIDGDPVDYLTRVLRPAEVRRERNELAALDAQTTEAVRQVEAGTSRRALARSKTSGAQSIAAIVTRGKRWAGRSRRERGAA